MSYWDTSALVKLYVQEADSALFGAHAASPLGTLVTSRIALYGAYATFRRKEMEGVIHTGAAKLLYSRLLQDAAAAQVHVLDLGNAVEQAYGIILDICYASMPALPVRTLDALHLASARTAGEAEIVATDWRLRDAAKLLGLSLFPA